MDIKALSLIAVVLLAASTIDNVSDDGFTAYKTSQNKHYSESEEFYRHAIYLSNLEKINAHNADET